MTKDEVVELVKEISPDDNDTYYVIDIQELENITLNYGDGYKSTSSTDKYVINELTHTVYYLNAIYYEGVEYHTIGLSNQ